MENGKNYSQNCLCNTNKFLSVYNLAKVAAWQSSNIGCFLLPIFRKSLNALIERFLKNKVKRVEEMQSERVFKRYLCEI